VDQETLVNAGGAGAYRVTGGEQVRGKAEGGGKVIGAAGGNIADRRRVAAGKQAGNDFVERSVPAAGDDQVCVSGVTAGKHRCVAPLVRDTDGDKITAGGQRGYHLRQQAVRLPGTGIGVDNQQQFLQHGHFLSRKYLYFITGKPKPQRQTDVRKQGLYLTLLEYILY